MTKNQLNKLTKKELLTQYPKANAKMSDLKADIVNAILAVDKPVAKKKAIGSNRNEY